VTSPAAAWDPESGLPAADAICAAVRQRIISGHYACGQRITEEQVAADFKASRMSVREALRMLNAEGFLVIRPYFGTHVATMTRKQVSDLLELQGGLEAMAAGFAAQRRSLADVEELRAVVAEGRRVSEGLSGSATSAVLHGRFHTVLARAAGNESLAMLMTQVRYKVDWVYASAVRRPQSDSWEEHSSIVDAIEAADPEGAAQAAKAHMQHAVEAHTGG